MIINNYDRKLRTDLTDNDCNRMLFCLLQNQNHLNPQKYVHQTGHF